MERLLLVVALILTMPMPVTATDLVDGLRVAQAINFETVMKLREIELRKLILLAERGDASAQYELGTMYARGLRVPQDDAKAMRWYRLAAEQGLADAQYELGTMYARGHDDAKAMTWYRLAAEQGLADAQYELGTMYARGHDDAKAMTWYRLAATDADLTLNAAYRNDIAKIRKLITAGADVNVRTNKGWSPLHIAAHADATDMAAILIGAGADIHAREINGSTPLHKAALKAAKTVAKLLIEAGAKVNARSKKGETPLHEAIAANYRCENIYIEMIDLLLASDASLNATDREGSTALHIAAEIRCGSHIVQLLLEAGAAIDQKDERGGTALHRAAAKGRWNNVKVLIDNGADGTIKDNNGRSPFDVADRLPLPPEDKIYWHLNDLQYR